MPAQEPVGPNLGAPSATEVVARLQELVDAKPTDGGGVALEWAVSAYFLGDVNGLACLSLRSET